MKKVTIVWIITGSHDRLNKPTILGNGHVKREGYFSNSYIVIPDEILIRPDKLVYRPDNIIIRPDKLYIVRTI